MLRLVVLSFCFGVCLSATYTGTYKTISAELQGLFQNDHMAGRIEWTSSTRLEGNGYPHYTVNCDGTPNSASSSHENILDIPSSQYIDSTSYCLPMGATGYALNGVAFFNAASAENEDAFTAEGQTFDGCGAHSQMHGVYHYHIIPGSTNPKRQGSSDCFPQIQVPEWQSNLGTTYFEGVALDGFPVFATVNNGQVVQEPDLDGCGGKPYTADRYAYFISPIFPYTFGCFKGQIQYTNSRAANNLQQCTGGGSGTSGYLCYCSFNGMTETDCLPSKGQDPSQCVVGAASDWQLSGTCLNTKPTDYVGTADTGAGSGTNGGAWGGPNMGGRGGRGRPNQQGGGMGQPNQQGGWGQPNQQGGGMGQPNQQGGWGQPNQQWGGMGQPNQQGGWGQPNQQGGGMGQPNQQGGWGQPNQQGGGIGQPNQQWGGMRPPMGGRGGRRGGRGGRRGGRGGFARRMLAELLDAY